MILVSNNEISDLKVSIINGEEFFSINETSKYCSFFEYNKEEQLDNLIPYQSELSLSLVENILVNKSSKLPLIDISLKTHIPFIRFVKQYSKHVKRKIKIT